MNRYKNVFVFVIFSLLVSLVPPAQAEWNNSSHKDRMTGHEFYYCYSSTVQTLDPMDFPYHNVESRIGFGYDCNTNYWAYFEFSMSPNLSNTRTEDGYNVVKIQMKFDDQNPIVLEAYQEWGSNVLHVRYPSNFRSYIERSKTLLIKLDWYGGPAYFEYSLVGSSNSITKMENSCH